MADSHLKAREKNNKEQSMSLRTLFISTKKFVIAICFLTQLSTTESLAEQWPVHPLPTNSSDVATYSRAIKLRPSLDGCLRNAAGVTSGIRDCMSAERVYQDNRLNKSYKKLMASFSESERVALRDEERKWIAFRDEFCVHDPDSGQGGELDYAECLVDQTADRATELESRMQN